MFEELLLAETEGMLEQIEFNCLFNISLPLFSFEISNDDAQHGMELFLMRFVSVADDEKACF